jgi:hypothetical protein
LNPVWHESVADPPPCCRPVLDCPDYDKELAVHHFETTKKEKRATKRQTIAAESFTRDFLDADIFGLFRMSIDSEPN